MRWRHTPIPAAAGLHGQDKVQVQGEGEGFHLFQKGPSRGKIHRESCPHTLPSGKGLYQPLPPWAQKGVA